MGQARIIKGLKKSTRSHPIYNLPWSKPRKQTPHNRILWTTHFAFYGITQTGTIQC